MNTSYLPEHIEHSVDLRASAAAVFEHLDDFEKLGKHMMRSSWMMSGSRMRYEFDEARGRKANARIRLVGSVLGMNLEIEEQVIERTPPVSKSWQTIGRPRMLVLDAYRMGFNLTPKEEACRLRVFIDYAKPRVGLGRWLGRLAGATYARWCVRSMIQDAVTRFGRRSEEPRDVPPVATR